MTDIYWIGGIRRSRSRDIKAYFNMLDGVIRSLRSDPPNFRMVKDYIEGAEGWAAHIKECHYE